MQTNNKINEDVMLLQGERKKMEYNCYGDECWE